MRLTILGSSIFIVTLLIGSVPLLFLGNSRLSCERMADGDGSCHLVNGSLLRGVNRTFPLEDLKKAELSRLPRRSSDGRFASSPDLLIVLHTTQGVLPLGTPTEYSSSYSTYESALQAQVSRIEAFRTGSKPATLVEGEDNTLMIIIFLVGFGGMGLGAALMLGSFP